MKKANSSLFLSMLGTKEMSQIESTSYKWLITTVTTQDNKPKAPEIK